MTNVEKVSAALRGMKSGLLLAEIAERAKLNCAQVSSALSCLKLTDTIIKHAGDTPNKSRYTLNPDATPDAATPATAHKPRGRAAKTLHDIAVKHTQRAANPLALTHISTTFDVVMEIADIDAMEPGMRAAFNAHREAIELARCV